MQLWISNSFKSIETHKISYGSLTKYKSNPTNLFHLTNIIHPFPIPNLQQDPIPYLQSPQILPSRKKPQTITNMKNELHF